MEIKIKKLKRFNIIMGTVHLIQGGLLFWLGTVVNSDFVVPITLTQLEELVLQKILQALH